MKDDDEEISLVRVNICDAHALSTILRASPGTTANDLGAILSTKLDIYDAEKRFFSLILVHSIYLESGTKHILKTLESNEKVLDILNKVEKKQDLYYKSASSSDGLKSESNNDNDSISFNENSLNNNNNNNNNNNKSTSNRSSRWFYKDIRSAPLELDGEVTGNSSSDDEEECSISDFNYLKQIERKGYFFRKSSKDPNLWRKRWCLLGDKFWAFTLSKQLPKSIGFEFHGNVKISECPIYSNSILAVSYNKTHHLKPLNSTEQSTWLSEMKFKCENKSDNDVISMAEMIICDEESTRVARLQGSIIQLLEAYKYKFVNYQEEIPKETELESDDCTEFLLDYCETNIRDDDNDGDGVYVNGECIDTVDKIDRDSIRVSGGTSKGINGASNFRHINTNIYLEGWRHYEFKKKITIQDYSHLDTSSILPLTSYIQKKDALFTTAINCMSAVQFYRELHRHDTRTTVKPWFLWLKVIQIFDRFFLPLIDNCIDNWLAYALPHNVVSHLVDKAQVIHGELKNTLKVLQPDESEGLTQQQQAEQSSCKVHIVDESQRNQILRSSSFKELNSPSNSIIKNSSRSFWSWSSDYEEKPIVAPSSTSRSNSYHDGKNHYYKRKDGSIYLLLDKYRRPCYNLFDDICELLESSLLRSPVFLNISDHDGSN